MTNDHIPPRLLAIDILCRVDDDNAYSNLLLSDILKKQALMPKDIAFLNQLVIGTLKWRGKIDWILSQYLSKKNQFLKLPTPIKNILRLGTYQLLFLDKIPDSAIVNTSVDLAKKYGHRGTASLTNAVLRNISKSKANLNSTYPKIEDNPALHISVVYSHPLWMVERWISRFGIDETIELCKSNNQPAPLTIRVNTLKISTKELRERFRNKFEMTDFDELQIANCGLRIHPDFITIEGNVNVSSLMNLDEYRDGLFTFQDEGAGWIASLLAPEPNDVILDLCSAPGGKLTHIAQICPSAKIIGIEKNPKRINLIKENVKRMGLTNVNLIIADGQQFNIKQPVNKILIDAPCSGLGVLRRKAESRWRKSLEQINELKKLQLSLLDSASKLLANNGIIVYSTCTIEPEENEHLIKEFLSLNKNFVLENANNFIPSSLVDNEGFYRVFPHIQGYDGTFGARLKKNE